MGNGLTKRELLEGLRYAEESCNERNGEMKQMVIDLLLSFIDDHEIRREVDNVLKTCR